MSPRQSFGGRTLSLALLLVAAMLLGAQWKFLAWALSYDDELSGVTPLGYVVIGEPFFLVAAAIFWVPAIALLALLGAAAARRWAAAARLIDQYAIRCTWVLAVGTVFLMAIALVIGYA